ncbi:MAG: NADP-dependent isocitrate dehydrogenase [Tepidimonas sp.]|uniref:NADP-dependent isocitrate dehydrogenase n=1 Tax=Tepidimonas sp. TaxID=2002775 RepID=UPI00298F19A8|nr:NADP-dependent isocitrate dehydrogenase [Tepidimonas sp.]MCS6809704.1 NADP-dependent isocitrate dehydrogenase [Tepidimonas sp.]MDW8335766.1 NADP-dependent isocitrate dehydrogenase [Tepidimonas sp.]
MSELVPITVARGDGIGPEIMDATLRVLQAAGARIAPEFIDIGEQQYLAGHSSGIAPEAWDSLRRTRVLLKGPITTPQGGGYKSLNVTIRKTLGLYANVRPCVSYAPFVRTLHPKMNLVIIRENEEDLYAGIEHRQTDEVYQCLKLITRPGCERIVRYAFEYARAHGRRKVTCMTKDNIMKMTDGLFHRVFDEIAPQYPEIETEHLIIDIGAARLATRPERFDVIVTPNLYGDILSDIAAELTGSVGLAPSANIGDHVAMFEAIHGSAPDIAGKGIANPSGLLLAAVMMLVHIGQPAVAETIHNAWLRTIEDGVHTAELHGTLSIGRPFGSMDFADAVIERLGQRPEQLAPVQYGTTPSAPGRAAGPRSAAANVPRRAPAAKALVGVDVFVHAAGVSADFLAGQLVALAVPPLGLQMITNRGVKVWPGGFPETFCTDHWRCRFVAAEATPVTHADIIALLQALVARGIDVIKTENLCTFDGERGFALGQGQ